MFAAIVITAATYLTSVSAGWLTWTLTEYVVHRWAFHHRAPGRVIGLIATEHIGHHREPLRTNLAMRLLGHSAVALAATPIGLALWTAAGFKIGLGVWLGFAGGYVTYEEGHWRLHHRAPSTRRGVTARQRHYAHHSVDAAINFGVTVSWWDKVFKTSSEPQVIAVPETHAAPWLVTGNHQGFTVKKR